LIKVTNRGSFRHMEAFAKRIQSRSYLTQLAKYGPIGVAELQKATPKDSSETANSWYYEIVDKPGYFAIHWYNANVEDPGRIPIAVLIQYGHGTGGGSYVEGVDYINPALRPIFDQIAVDMWKEVTK